MDRIPMYHTCHLVADYSCMSGEYQGEIWEEIQGIKEGILAILQRDHITNIHIIYEELECPDTTMYLAIHELTLSKKISGLSPYDVTAPSRHDYHILRKA